MKLRIVLMMFCVFCASCGPNVLRLANTPFIYVETKGKTLWGVETENQRRLEPIFDAIDNTAFPYRAYLATKDGVTIMYDYWGNPLCDSIPVIRSESYHSNLGGTGVPGAYYEVNTKKGRFCLYYNKDMAEWYHYGPFEACVGGCSGYMFKDIKTGKWGVAKYGRWDDLGDRDSYGRRRMTLDAQWKFRYERNHVIVQPVYERVLNVSYVAVGTIDGGRRGYGKESDVRWYAYDGTKWIAFDINGHPIPVRDAELRMALRTTPHDQTLRRNSLNNVITQRIGTQEASHFLINPRANRIL